MYMNCHEKKNGVKISFSFTLVGMWIQKQTKNNNWGLRVKYLLNIV